MVRHCHGLLVLADCFHLMERSIQVAREACNQESLSKWTVTWPDSDEGCFLLYYSEVGQKILQRAPYGQGEYSESACLYRVDQQAEKQWAQGSPCCTPSADGIKWSKQNRVEGLEYAELTYWKRSFKHAHK